MARPTFDAERARLIVIAAEQLGDKAAAKRFKVGVRTIQGYRSRLRDDPELARVRAVEKEANHGSFIEELAAAKRETMTLLLALARQSDNLYHVTGAFKVLSDAENASIVIEKGLGDGGLSQPGAGAARTSGPPAEAPRRALSILGGGKS